MPGAAGPHHSKAWHSCVLKVGADGKVDSPEAVCTAALGDASYGEADGAGEDLSEAQIGQINDQLARKGHEAIPVTAFGQLVRPGAGGPGTTESRRPAVRFTEVARKREFAGATNGAVGPIDKVRNCVPVVIIREGPGNRKDRHYYLRSAIESGVVVFNGAKANLDHPDAVAERVQPEGTLRRLVGYYRNLKVVEASDGRAELQAELQFLNPPAGGEDSDVVKHAKSLCETSAAHAEEFPTGDVFIGVSINADGEDRPAVIDGERYNAVTVFTEATSADLVTFPGAGGRIGGHLESAATLRGLGREREARAMEKSVMGKIKGAVGKVKAAENEEAYGKALGELETLVAAAEMASEATPAAPASPAPAAPATETEQEKRKKATEEEARKRAAEEAETKKAAEEAARREGDVHVHVPADGDAAPTEAAQAKANRLRETAKKIEKEDPESAALLVQQADAIGKRTGDFSDLRKRLHEAETELRVRRSAGMARTLLAEAGLSEADVPLRRLLALDEDGMRAEIAATKRIYDRALESARDALGASIEGAGARGVVVRPSAGSSVARAREAGIPLKKKEAAKK